MANIKDFATSLIATAPSPATSGTSLVLAAGMGARMPAVPFNAVVHPDGQLPTIDNAEQVLVTARTTDTLTITRAQGLTTAKSIAAGWRLSNSIFAQDILNASSVTDELMTGTVNGTNKVFTTGSNFTNIQVYKNGVAMHLTDDFTVTGANQITFVTAPATGTKLTASYILGSQTMINGSSSLLQDETPTGTVNGTNTAFTTTRPYIANTLEVFINGVKQKRGTHFTETTPTSGTFTMGDAPLTGDDIMVNYQFVQSSYGNADTVDGYHYYDAMPLASVIDYAADTLPSTNWALCYGQAISRTTYAALFSLIGTIYGTGDGSTTFNLPDLRGRVVAGQDDMGGTSANRLTNPGSVGGMDGDILGNTGGQEAHVQTLAEIASHSHTVNRTTGAGTTDYGIPGTNNTWQTNGTTAVNGAGSSTPFNIVQPTIILNKIIKVA